MSGQKIYKNKPMKASMDMMVFNLIGTILVVFFALACLIPFYLVLTGSFTDEKWILTKGYSFFLNAENFSTEGYKIVFKSPEAVLSAYGVTTFVTVAGTVLAILITTMTGFVLSRPDFPWRNGFSFFFFFTTLFNGGLVPWYLLCTQTLKFTNHLYALILPGLFSVWNMIIAKSFMKGIPYELVESAKVDGASECLIYFRIMVPLSKPLIATLSLFTALGYWNDWYNCMLFINDSSKWNLQYTLQNILNSSEALNRMASQTGMKVASLPAESMKMAMTVVAIGPIILLYPFLQKYFVKGMTVGSVKG
ncbi:sugar ABC transporter permease [Eisenbergiella tayi]|uniref:carbohydrate ABC transporter permease n=1 Tax=Eisenbergiella tayi TaxID=1432052 RepID=UPI0008FCE60D|nr:carbohydrate ABC transporter permease [Eisenbergiella tayi]OIZ64725.1 sugar ABC transporter permease [Eisenbergiella tayi]